MKIVTYSIVEFGTTVMLTNRLISRAQFDAEMNKMIDKSQKKIATLFARTLDFIAPGATTRTSTKSAQLLNGNSTLMHAFKGWVSVCYRIETVLLSSLSYFYSEIFICNFRQPSHLLTLPPR